MNNNYTERIEIRNFRKRFAQMLSDKVSYATIANIILEQPFSKATKSELMVVAMEELEKLLKN